MWAVVEGDQIIQLIEKPHTVRVQGKLWPRGIFRHWSDERLAAIGILPVEVADLSPEFHVRTGEQFQVLTDRVLLEYTYSPLPVDDVRDAAHERINRWKQRKQDGVFTHEGSEYQCDPRSRDFIIGRALDAFISLSQSLPFSIEFRDAENVDHSLNASQMIGLARAAATHVQHWHDEAKALKDQVDAALTVDEILTILSSLEE